MKRIFRTACLTFCLIAALPRLATAQTANVVGHLTVDKPGVAVQRDGTSAWISVQYESLIGPGDGIRTDKDGNATLSFDAEVIHIRLSPDTEVSLKRYQKTGDDFDLQVAIKTGFTQQNTLRTLDANSSFQLALPTFTVHMLDGTTLVRVEPSGRSAVLITTTGKATVDSGSHTGIIISAKTGARQGQGEPLSEVVPATSFPTLDSAIDGCPGVVTLDGDVRLNVRLGATLAFPRIGLLDSGSTVQAMGISSAGGWYRIRYSGGYGWITIPTLPLDKSCAGLRVFPPKYGPEDTRLYNPPVEIVAVPAATAAVPLAATAVATTTP